jgi:uncharacterized protein (UPF0335 family)
MSETPEQGHNANGQLKSIVERIESVETTIKEHQEERADIYTEAKSNGFDVPALRAIIRARRDTAEQKAKRHAREENEELYRGALGIS